MRKGIYILFAVITLLSCADKNKQLTGTWIEKDNFRNPRIFKFAEDSFQVYEGKYLVDSKIFLIKKDTFVLQCYKEICKSRIKFIGNTFSFLDLSNDTVLGSYEKGDFKNPLDYFNYKKGTKISLPTLYSEEISEIQNINSIYIDSQNNIYLNGTKTTIKNLANLLTPNTEFERIYTCIYCDKTVSHSKLQEVKNELMKTQYNLVTYITQNNENELYGINVKLPQSIESESILDLIAENDFENLICFVTKDSIDLNGKEISSKELHKLLKDKIYHKKNELNLFVCFDNNLSYETYLKELYNIRSAYYSVRKEYSKNKFGDSEYENMGDSITSTIRETYPMRLAEINENAYKRLKYAP
jgi:biopolymer transport protein ExbD